MCRQGWYDEKIRCDALGAASTEAMKNVEGVRSPADTVLGAVVDKKFEKFDWKTLNK